MFGCECRVVFIVHRVHYTAMTQRRREDPVQVINPLTQRRITVGGASWQAIQQDSNEEHVLELQPMGIVTFPVEGMRQVTTALYYVQKQPTGYVGTGTTFSVFDVSLRGALLRRHIDPRSRKLEITLHIAAVMQLISRCKWVNQLVGLVRFMGPLQTRHKDGEWGLLITKVPNAAPLGSYVKSLPEKTREAAVSELKEQSVDIARCLWKNRVEFDSAGINNVLIDTDTRQLHVIDINVTSNEGRSQNSIVQDLCSYVEKMCWSLIEQDRRDEERRRNGPSDPLLRDLWLYAR